MVITKKKKKKNAAKVPDLVEEFGVLWNHPTLTSPCHP